MCGVFIVFSKKEKTRKGVCIKSIQKLFNRGPDRLKYNFFYKDRLFIANTILSITGNLNNSKNLYYSDSKNYYLSFNGEIYNYHQLNSQFFKKKFITDSDFLVNLHDKVVYDKIPLLLNGMFAYVILDKQQESLKVVTDPQGEKTLYYYNDDNFFIVSSTIDIIIFFLKENGINININENVIKDYFSTRHFMPIKETCFKKIYNLQNGSILEFNLKNSYFRIKKYDDPINWICKKKYLFFSKMKENDLIEYLDFELNKQIKLMIPEKNFGTIFSGGIDSSLQSAILQKYSEPTCFLNINHESKDFINKEFGNFEKYLKRKIVVRKISKGQYRGFSKKCYDIMMSPLSTHDVPSRMYLSNLFKKKKCKVFFSADGCDELLGGQQIYLNVFNKRNLKKNNSPYTFVKKNSMFLKKYTTSPGYLKYLEENWNKVLKKYSFLKNLKERNILSSLYLDYFIQSVNVANKSTDLICCNSSVEPRNVFIQKNILKIFINLPLKYRINKDAEKIFRQKYILKKLFIRYFDKTMLFPKEGFSGFPEIFYKEKYKIEKYIANFIIKSSDKRYYDKKNFNRDLSWKLSNVEMFFKKFYTEINAK